MRTDRDRLHLEHIVDSATAILEFTAAGRDAFLEDRKTRDAVVRNLEIIGEAAKRLSTRVRDGNPHVPWRQIAGLRDFVIHQYDHVDYNEVWNVVENDLQTLLKHVRAILGKQD